MKRTLLILVMCDLAFCNDNTTISGEVEESTTDPNDHIGLIRPTKDLSIWIDEDQVKFFSGIRHLVIHVVANGIVMPYLLDRNLETHLPVIPPEVEEVRFRWRAGKRKYKYNFYRLESHDQHLLLNPTIDISSKGKIPRKPGAFSVRLPCTGNLTGIASFSIGLEILSRKKKLAGTPLKLRLRKECIALGPNPNCDRKCNSRGQCDSNGGCICRPGWEGAFCSVPVCAPQCMNGGACSAPGVCDCPAGFQGRSCEGGICEQPCQNRGKCIQKDTCKCKTGFYGSRCEFSKCVVPCLNGGDCKGVNKCRCRSGYSGNHCQIMAQDKRRGREEHTGYCEVDECRSFKKCRKNHCGLINKINKSQLKACKMAYCGALLDCDHSSCGRAANKDGRRRKKRRKQRLL
eukprot:GFUD01021316.1.p1 GENE.GFUD01021316.1~~GFUD01021316.1.p1  ORF type:complete len:402 (-),score=59.36 GFUD01021316.1:38-1243(-)